MIENFAPRYDRRAVLRMLGAVGAATAGVPLGAGCGSGPPATGRPADGPIRLGYVSPATGTLAAYGAADAFVINAMRSYFARNPITVGGRRFPVEILDRDSQSDPNRAADVADDLIVNHGVQLMMVAATPETANPVSDQCETSGVPCVATAAPWELWYFGRAATRETPFHWTYHFFWGLDDAAAVYADMWDEVDTNKIVGGLWPDDAEGRAWGDPGAGLPAAQAPRGYRVVGPTPYAGGAGGVATTIEKFRDAGSQILVGVPPPADFSSFWRQAGPRGFRPRIATIGKALLFPSGVEALGPLGRNLSTEVWWSPSHPFASSLTGQTARQLADAYTAATGRQWTHPLGFAHALFEVAVAAFGAVAAIDDREGLVAAIGGLAIDTVVGRLDWTHGPVRNVATTPLVGGQWRTGSNNPFELVIVNNTRSPGIPTAGRVQELATRD